MTFCPFARQELVGPHSSTSLIGHSLGLVFHVNASDGDPWSTFETGEADSHWQIMKTGELIQYVDSDLDSWAQIDGNNSYHSCETEGYPTEALTAAQMATFSKLYAWGHKQYGWPLEIAETVGQPGFGWHGMGGDSWGGHFGCPGDLRKAQRPAILAAARALLSASGAPAVTAPAAPVAAAAGSATTVTIEGTTMLQIFAHGRNHLFGVQSDGKLIWRAHQPNGAWKGTALVAGAERADPALWTSTGPSEAPITEGEVRPVVEFLHAAVTLADGKVWHGWNEPGQPWKTQTWPAV